MCYSILLPRLLQPYFLLQAFFMEPQENGPMGQNTFNPENRATLIGSFPVSDHKSALEMVLRTVPQIPPWAQLPAYPEEGMIDQFVCGLPGVKHKKSKIILDTSDRDFDAWLLNFYEDYLAVSQAGKVPDGSRFALTEKKAPGFFVLEKALESWPELLFAVKGQVTGPFTLATALKDSQDRAAFYDDRLRDCITKSLAQKARWQVQRLSRFGVPVILFLDEPALAGFGSSAFISVSAQDVASCLGEVISQVHEAGGLAGIHVCANTDWGLVLESGASIVNFDAYSFMEHFLLYAKELKAFLDAGNTVAWGIIPTADPADIWRESAASLAGLYQNAVLSLEKTGIDAKKLRAQSLITPACGLGSLDLDSAARVLELTRDVSALLRG
jgi:methionine synthase II (cobalamin-independent)